eukprot:CAMPEP_0201570936 /NCGR_PEP_ID=MMETSP0190_2-20130828/13415_1 /ASSEMBLY_ACC=CAM_ASM_000263 /TAXON_ID=37353 /ORGANISM="Rosalina sp." /LENGTH=731 /DNA_ID=CAMNT_0047995009 /DNA_START=90 /DNA_END=2282 /DNA_ORIENTATION=+
MEAMLLKKKKTLKNAAPPEPTANEAPIREDDPFQGLQPDLNINQVRKADHNQRPQQNNYHNQSSVKYSNGRDIGDSEVRMGGQSVQKWIRQQEKAFTGWVNAHLQTRSMFVESLQKDISRVSPLIHLLEILEKKPLKEITKYHKKPRHKFDMLDGMRICLKQIRSRGRKDIKVGFDAEILLKGEQKKQYLALIWRIIVNYAIEDTTAEEILDNKKRKFKTPEARLRWWCNSRLTEELQISNFTKNWSDGQVLVHLMNQALDENDRITQEDMQDMDTEELLEGLLKLGDKHLHIPQLLDPYDLMHSPNKEAVMTYVSLLRTAIEAKDQERSAAEASMKKMKDAFANLEDNWLNRVKELENRLEDAQRQQAEYAEKLQEERHVNSKQLHAAKDKTDKLYQEIEQLKALCLDQQHQKEMMQQDAIANDNKYKQEIQRLKAQILQLQAQNDALNEQLKEVLDSQSKQSGASEQQKSAFEMQLNNLKTNHSAKEKDLQNKVGELEALNEQQRKKFNEFYEQYKKKLESSNKAGREYREKCIVVAADTEALRKRIAELEALLKQKEKELEDARKREKELLEQLATQETVFRIQLQELGQFIKEMKQREQVREKQQVEAYHKLLKEREARIAKDKERKRKSGLNQTRTKDGKIALDAVDIDAQRMALEQFQRRKSQQGQPPPPAGPAPNKGKYSGKGNPLLNDDVIPSGKGGGGKPAFDKKTEAVRTKFGNEKIITTW